MGDFIVLAVIGIVCFFIVRGMYKNKKKGSCSCGCATCEKRNLCHPKTDEKEK